MNESTRAVLASTSGISPQGGYNVDLPRKLTGTLPVDSAFDAIDWLSDFNDVSASWVPTANNNHEDTTHGAVIDPGTLGDLFHSSFSMWSVVDNPLQISGVNIPDE